MLVGLREQILFEFIFLLMRAQKISHQPCMPWRCSKAQAGKQRENSCLFYRQSCRISCPSFGKSILCLPRNINYVMVYTCGTAVLKEKLETHILPKIVGKRRLFCPPPDHLHDFCHELCVLVWDGSYHRSPVHIGLAHDMQDHIRARAVRLVSTIVLLRHQPLYHPPTTQRPQWSL